MHHLKAICIFLKTLKVQETNNHILAPNQTVLELLLPSTQVPDYWVLGPSGKDLGAAGCGCWLHDYVQGQLCPSLMRFRVQGLRVENYYILEHLFLRADATQTRRVWKNTWNIKLAQKVHAGMQDIRWAHPKVFRSRKLSKLPKMHLVT